MYLCPGIAGGELRRVGTGSGRASSSVSISDCLSSWWPQRDSRAGGPRPHLRDSWHGHSPLVTPPQGDTPVRLLALNACPFGCRGPLCSDGNSLVPLELRGKGGVHL